MARINFDVPAELKRAARKQAIDDGTTLAAVLRELLAGWVRGAAPDAVPPRGNPGER